MSVGQSNVTFLFICDNIYKVRSVLKYLSCWRSPSFIMEIHTLITAVWLDHYWRSYCFFTWIFHQTVYMFNLSCILNINSSKLCILTYCQLWNYYKVGVCLIWSTKTFWAWWLCLLFCKSEIQDDSNCRTKFHHGILLEKYC